MLYRIGTRKEIPILSCKLPEKVTTELYQGLVVLDCEYGEDRDYLASGGYSVIVESIEDIAELHKIISENHPCEWATKIGNTGDVSALYIINDDFSIMVYMPQEIATQDILQELED